MFKIIVMKNIIHFIKILLELFLLVYVITFIKILFRGKNLLIFVSFN